MDEISTGGWIAIIFLIGLLLATNLSLFSILRSKKNSPPGFRSSLDRMKNPWEVEDQQWQRLNAAVRQLGERQDDDSQTR